MASSQLFLKSIFVIYTILWRIVCPLPFLAVSDTGSTSMGGWLIWRFVSEGCKRPHA